MDDVQPAPPTIGADVTAADDHRCAGRCGRQVNRRAALGAGFVVGAVALAACGSPGSPASTTAGASVPRTSSAPPASLASSSGTSPAATSAAPSTSPGSSAATGAGSSGAAPDGTELAKLSDIPDGGSVIVQNGDASIALAKKPDGSVVAHSAVCTHRGSIVEAEGDTLTCYSHGSKYNAFTGVVTRSPAQDPLPTLTVTVFDDAVFLQS